MPPNLRCVAAQAWRSIGSRRNLSSSPGSKGNVLREKHVTVPASATYLNTFSIPTYMATGFSIYALIELYRSIKVGQEMERKFDSIRQLMKKKRTLVLGPTKE